MEKHYFFFGSQPMEFKRPKVPTIIYRDGIKCKIKDSEYSLTIKPNIYKLVMLNVHN
jgi:hypothetical protein